jgi:hypothetical protein
VDRKLLSIMNLGRKSINGHVRLSCDFARPCAAQGRAEVMAAGCLTLPKLGRLPGFARLTEKLFLRADEC